jgi:hypothetical protein
VRQGGLQDPDKNMNKKIIVATIVLTTIILLLSVYVSTLNKHVQFRYKQTVEYWQIFQVDNDPFYIAIEPDMEDVIIGVDIPDLIADLKEGGHIKGNINP